MFKQIIEKLYKKYCAPKLSVVEMTRLDMLGVTMAAEILDLPRPEQKQIMEEARTLLESSVLKLAIDNVKNRAMKHIQEEALTAEVIFYDRFIINGASLVEAELKYYADMTFESDDESFDEQGI